MTVRTENANLRHALRRLLNANAAFWRIAVEDSEDIGGQADRLSDATDEQNAARAEALALLDFPEPPLARSIVDILRRSPGLAWDVLRAVKVAGPWHRAGWSYRRLVPHAGAVHAHGTTRRKLEAADVEAVRQGYLLVGGVPEDVDPECGEEHEGWCVVTGEAWGGREPFVCDQAVGHTAACAGVGQRTGDRVTARNAMERK